jgi:hypothetical protein
VKADQVSTWGVGTNTSYARYAENVEALTEALAAAEDVTP